MPKRNSEQDLHRLYKIGQAKKDVFDEFINKHGKSLLKEGEFFVVGSGMPEWRWTPEYGEELIITPETDIRNEVVIQHIETWQREMLKKRNPPPQPQLVKGSKKLDWKPVWVWARTHPQITIKEIAAMLNRNYTHVKSKLEELDKQTGDIFPSKSSM